MGHRPPAEVHADLARGGVFCGPSRRTAAGAVEGLGTVFLEAAAHGLAVAAYRSGGVPEAVADGTTGLLAPEGDVPALARALCALLDDPALARRLGEAGIHVRRFAETPARLRFGLPADKQAWCRLSRILR